MTYIGPLNMIDTSRFKRGEITLEQAAAIAAANTASAEASLRAQMEEGSRARQRNRKWLNEEVK